ncbi:HNH endonuclease signature motif containing protein [Staphylococcus chromogenes]|nr:HNH endonuclease signature motif containing protein [Staphylococcus chromogenes]
MNHLEQALRHCDLALHADLTAQNIRTVVSIKEAIARTETSIAADSSTRELTSHGMTRRAARAAIRRTSFSWYDRVGVEHQDEILAALEKLTPVSNRRNEIYAIAAEAATRSSLRQIREFTRGLVRAENERLSDDPFVAYAMRSFRLNAPDEHGGCRVVGYLPPAIAALLKAHLDEGFKASSIAEDDNRRIDQRTHDAFAHLMKCADNAQNAQRGHCALVVSVTEDDEFSIEAKFGTNVGIDLNLFDIAHLCGDKIIDYVAIHDHSGAVKQLRTANRSANFHQRIALLAEQAVCQHPGCDSPTSRCDAHHVVPWARGGPTSLQNLALLCRFHHRKVDDTWFGDHLRKTGAATTWVKADGTEDRNESPAAQRAPGRRLRHPPPHPPPSEPTQT